MTEGFRIIGINPIHIRAIKDNEGVIEDYIFTLDSSGGIATIIKLPTDEEIDKAIEEYKNETGLTLKQQNAKHAREKRISS